MKLWEQAEAAEAEAKVAAAELREVAGVRLLRGWSVTLRTFLPV